MFTENLILKTDSYKFTHHRQNPSWVKYKNSYIEARGGDFGYTCLVGTQMMLRYIKRGVSVEDISEAQGYVDPHMGEGVFNRADLEKIVEVYHGQLPLEIESLPEGGCYPHGTPLLQVRNIDPRYPWLPAYMETLIQRFIWYPSTVATLSRECKKVIKYYLDLTSDDTAGQLPFKLHDFGARGASSGESAAIGGVGHLVNFKGTDTVEALVLARKCYGEHMAGFSIPASEHSTATCWGPGAGELAYVNNMVQEFGGKGKLLAIVGDSYNIFEFSDRVMENAKKLILDSGCTVVVRPDSGNPSYVVVEVLKSLARIFGTETNKKGFAVLNPCVRVIQGDGMDIHEIEAVLQNVMGNKFSADNVTFGMGGGLLQKVNRDTHRFAMKTSAAAGLDYRWVDICKNPVTDPQKSSKVGIFQGIPRVWRAGESLVTTTLAEVRHNAEIRD